MGERGGKIQVRPSENFPIHAYVYVEVRDRVARVFVDPILRAGPVSEISWSWQVGLRLPFIMVSVVGEQPPTEVFSVALTELSLKVDQTASGQRETECELNRIQIDMQHPKPEVILASVSPRALRLRLLQEDVARGDVVIRRAVIEPGMFECTVSQQLLTRARRFAEIAIPRPLGLEMDSVLSRSGVPYNLSCGLPVVSRKYVIHRLEIGDVKLGAWCRLSVSLLPNMVGVLMTISSLSPTLEVDGARIKLPAQSFFGGGPFEGSIQAVGSIVWRRYRPCVKDSWRSVLNNSNAIFGGFFTRHAWIPRSRTITAPQKTMLQVVRGVVNDPVAWTKANMKKASDEIVSSASSRRSIDSGREGSNAIADVVELDEHGFRKVVSTGSVSEMRVFVRRLVEMFGGQVVGDAALSNLAARYCSQSPTHVQREHDFFQLVEEISAKECQWIRPSKSQSW